MKLIITTVLFHSVFILGTFEGLAQQTISGTVTSEREAEGIPGATIRIKNSNKGTVTNADGYYSIVSSPDDILVISSIGFITTEILVGAKTVVDVQLHHDIKELETVVVVGYGTQRKSDITGSVASVRIEDFNPGPVVSVSNLLQSTAPGVVLTQSSSQPGGGFDIKVRGTSSVLGNSGPLYVIDGLPITSDNVEPSSASRYRSAPARNPLNGINPKDIVSIEVLKDASATAIYGARGANGVILITTKRGESGQLSIDYNASLSIQELDTDYDMLNGTEFARASNEIFLSRNPGADPIFSAAQVNLAGDGTNWIDEITRIGSIQQHQLGLSAGSRKLKYYVSGNYYKHNGIVKVSALERFGGRANLDYTTGKLKLSTSVIASRTRDFQIPFGGSGGPEFAGIFDNTRLWSPLVSVRQADGSFSLHPVRTEIPNPISLLDIEDVITTNRLLGTFFVEYNLFEGVKAKVNIGIDRSGADRQAYIPVTVIRGSQANGEGEHGTTDKRNILTEFTLSYNKEWEKGNSFDAVAGYTFQQFDSEGNTALFINFADQTTDFDQITSADTVFNQPFKERSRLLSYLARANYNIQNRYLLTFSFRADGSTKFGPNNKWGYFPSAALAWKIHNEDFFSSGFFDQLKLRFSYGQIGNQEIGNKRSQSLYNLTRRTVLGLDGAPVTGLAALRPDNPDLKWETSAQFNFGIDFAILKSRVYGNIDAYSKLTKDVLLNFQLPGTAGFSVVTTNAGSILNRGIELSLTSKNFVNEFKWTSSLNIAYNNNQWKERAGFYPEGQQIAEENGPLGGIYGYFVEGLFQSQDEINNSPDQSAVAIPRPGTFRYRDTNGDGSITPDDRVLLGKSAPDYTFGLNNSMEYKNFYLNFFFQGAIGREKQNSRRAYLEDGDDITEGFNKSVDLLDRWTINNPSATISGIDQMIGGQANNTVYIEDASFVRLRNITLGYNFGQVKWFRNLRIYADTQNLITLTKFKGTDPETSEGRQYPNSKTYTVGLNVSF